MSHKSKHVATTSKSASELLENALAALDAIITDAQSQQEAEDSTPVGQKRRQRGGDDVFAAMAEPHFRSLHSLVNMCGVQLLPSLDALVRRVLLALSSPRTASSACWELAALLGVRFRAGAARLLEEVMGLLLGEGGVFLLEAPCLAGTTRATVAARRGTATTATGTEESGEADNDVDPATSGEAAASRVGVKVEERKSTVVRNLRAFEDLLLAVGPYLATSIMQRATLRFAQEVVMGGILDAPPSCPSMSNNRSGAGKGSKKRPANDEDNINNNTNDTNFKGNTQLQASPPDVAFAVEAALHPLCIDVLTTFLLLCRPLPGVVSACAVRAVKELPAWPITTRHQQENERLLRAVTRLSVTLTALRHPHAVPFYLPPVDLVERATRPVREHVSLSDGAVAQLVVVETSAAVKQHEDEQRHIAAVPAPSVSATVPTQQTAPALRKQEDKQEQQQQWKTLLEPNPGSKDRSSASALQQEEVHSQPPLCVAPVANGAGEEEEDDIPDIDLED